PWRTTVRKPGSSTRISYVLGLRFGARYRPCSLVTTTRLSPVRMLVTVTVTPGSTAPVESVTRPATIPNVVWPETRSEARPETAPTEMRTETPQPAISTSCDRRGAIARTKSAGKPEASAILGARGSQGQRKFAHNGRAWAEEFAIRAGH